MLRKIRFLLAPRNPQIMLEGLTWAKACRNATCVVRILRIVDVYSVLTSIDDVFNSCCAHKRFSLLCNSSFFLVKQFTYERLCVWWQSTSSESTFPVPVKAKGQVPEMEVDASHN